MDTFRISFFDSESQDKPTVTPLLLLYKHHLIKELFGQRPKSTENRINEIRELVKLSRKSDFSCCEIGVNTDNFNR